MCDTLAAQVEDIKSNKGVRALLLGFLYFVVGFMLTVAKYALERFSPLECLVQVLEVSDFVS